MSFAVRTDSKPNFTKTPASPLGPVSHHGFVSSCTISPAASVHDLGRVAVKPASVAFDQSGDVGKEEAGGMRTFAGASPSAPTHVDGMDDENQTPDSSGTSSTGGAQVSPLQQAPVTTPCPTTVSIGAVDQRNHSNLPASEKDSWRTWLGAMSRMDVGPGPDHTGHCMKERVTLVSNNCPAAMYTQGGRTIEPCSGDRCLDINRYGTLWNVSDGPTSFLDMHRTRAPNSLLEGTGVSSCSVVCGQTYTCDRTRPTTGRFLITRNFQAGTHTRADGTTVHITTGRVTKTAAP